VREALLQSGYYAVLGDPISRRALYLVVTQLRAEGHAAIFEDTILNGRITRATAHHYLSCNECRRQRDKG
jgi:hypothetical protein